MTKHIGILTAGGDSPGLNAAIRGVGKAAQSHYDMQMIGFLDGFRGLVDNRFQRMDGDVLSGILTRGGTILGTSRDKPHRMLFGGKTQDMTDVIVENYRANHLDCLVCIGGGGTQKNALRLMEKGLNIITLPKTIDNDVARTDVTFGFDTALGIATEAIDRLHSTAHSHHRIIVVEIMGHRAGWLALGAGIAGGADVILLPEIPYDLEVVADAIRQRQRGGKNFSIVAVAEGALPKDKASLVQEAEQRKANASSKKEKKEAKEELARLAQDYANNTVLLSSELEKLTGLESRVTILGHLQRGGTPSAADRLLATRLGTACADLIANEQYGVMVSSQGDTAVPVPLDEVAGNKKLVPPDHPWVTSALHVGTCLGITE
ncbi:MAG TPA: 6-phosphofructokinase [Thiolapillus brandeum]|uniref:ATP-dependent 6-phosphofructokinase n=1 Tax=Thiolapillus brandeum TaxID=1076588 RepID=A0A831RTL6_9GAMM|nr:6-phosphofructokinase [Thiolapillus brandeum]